MMYAFISIIIIILIIFFLLYNKLIRLKNKVKQAQSGIDVYLNQRFDLIPNLVECVKAYSNYESTTFENVIKLREAYNQEKDTNFEQANEINKEFDSILAIAENYPELKASEQYLKLQKSLIKIESQLQAARRIYNNAVTSYNTAIETIPTNMVANMFKFKKADLFQIEEYKKENINVNIEE